MLADRVERLTPGERIEVLLISAHPELGMAVEAMLDRTQYHVTTSGSGSDALARILKQEFAVVLLDIALPTRDGFETARRLGQHEASRAIPIIFLAGGIAGGSADPALLSKSYELGASDVLIGTLDPMLLRAKVAVFARLQLRVTAARNGERALRDAERKRSERALRQRDAEYDATFENARSALAHIGLDGYVLRANARLCELLGRDREALCARALPALLHPEDMTAGLAALERVRTGKESSERIELRCVHARGSIVVLDVTISLLRDGAGRPSKVLLSADDAGEAKRKSFEQRALGRASEILLQDLHDEADLSRLARAAVPDLADYCVVELDAEGPELATQRIIAHVDPARAQALGELADDKMLRVLFGGDLARRERRAVCVNELATDPAYGGIPLPLRRKLRAMRIESMLVVPLYARGALLGSMTWVATNQRARYLEADIPLAEELARRVVLALDNANLREEAQRAERARDEFLSIASHELRTPLTPLQIQLQRLLSMRGQNSFANLPPEQLRSMLARAVLQVGRISTLVDNVLDVSRLKSGRLRLQMEEVDLAVLTRKTIARFSTSFAAAGCIVSFDASQPVVSCDRGRIEQVLMNLIGNALKYGSSRPIAISVEEREGCAMLRVTDHGVGIAPEKLRLIFERFERASDYRAYGGLGLGLYLVRQIVDAHGGTISVQSEPARGSTFTVELPRRLEATDAPTLRAPSLVPTEHLTGSRSILLIEDDADIRECMSDLLLQQGHRVDVAVNGFDALERLRKSPKPDLILLDLMMPVMDGFHFRAEQRKTSAIADIPVVVLSGDSNVRERAKELRAQGFMTKPPNVDELLLVLDRIFNAAQAAQAGSV